LIRKFLRNKAKTIVIKGNSWYIISELRAEWVMPTLLLCLKGAMSVENTNRIRTLIVPLLEQQQLCLYDINWRKEGSTSILQIAIMRADGSMDIDTCASVSEQISEVLDREDFIRHEYFLEVCSPGAERELRSEEDLQHAIGEYIYIKYRDPKAGRFEIYGTLMEVNAHACHIAYMDKAVKKEMDVDRDNIAFVRLAVKM